MPKKITERIVTGQRGVNLVESIILEMGFAFHQTGAMEAGIDGIIEIRDPVTEEVKNLILQMQSKATLGRFTGETETTFHFTCEEDDLGYWMTGNVPVIFVRSRPSTGEAYWVSIKDYFMDATRRRSRRIDFDKVKDRFTPECADALAKLATRNVPGLVFARPHVIETLYSNLLRVTEFAPNLHIAKTTLRDRADVWKIVSADGRASGEWVLNGGYLYSFVDQIGRAHV